MSRAVVSPKERDETAPMSFVVSPKERDETAPMSFEDGIHGIRAKLGGLTKTEVMYVAPAETFLIELVRRLTGDRRPPNMPDGAVLLVVATEKCYICSGDVL